LAASKGSLLSAVIEKPRTDPFDEDAVLVDRYLSGEEAAFEQIYRKYYDKVFAISRGVLIDHDEAADAVQEVFTLVYRHLNRFDRRSKFSTWLFRIAVNRSIQEARKHKNRYRNVELTEAAAKEAPVEAEEMDPKIQVALSKLSPQDRALITLFYWEDLSLNEIADSLSTNVNAAKTRLYRARERFRVFYEELES
jgi:RNA polymerase sigma-70 factor (ECF subfamily)